MLLFSVLFFKILLKVENKYAAKETLLEYEEQSAERFFLFIKLSLLHCWFLLTIFAFI